MKKRKEVVESKDSDDAGADQEGQKKKMIIKSGSTSPAGSLAVVENIVKAMSDTQQELQRNQQKLLSGVMKEQQTHSRNLMQSQMRVPG